MTEVSPTATRAPRMVSGGRFAQSSTACSGITMAGTAQSSAMSTPSCSNSPRFLCATCSSRVDQCDAIENGHSTRLEGDAF